MNEFENIQRLLRLKQYETPGDDFVEDFVTQFRERQRSELLRQSARGLLWDRVNTYFTDLISPKWATASATAAFAIVAAWGSLGIIGYESRSESEFSLAAADSSVPAILQNKPSFAVESELIKEVQPQGEKLEIEAVLLSNHFEDDQLAARDVNAFGPMSNQAMPISAELLPISDFSR